MVELMKDQIKGYVAIAVIILIFVALFLGIAVIFRKIFVNQLGCQLKHLCGRLKLLYYLYY